MVNPINRPPSGIPKPYRMRVRDLFVLGGLVLTLGGCVGNKSLNYLNDPSLTPGASKLFENQRFEYRIQVNDVMSIRVLGLDEQTHRYFNVESQNGTAGLSDASLYVNGFSVDRTGMVQLPQVGKVKLQGLTIGEAQELVQRKINEYFTNATVILKMINWRISLLGNVSRPGTYMVYNNQITILDALAMAGGPNEFADKSHVTLMRQSDRGVQSLYVDLSTTEVLRSEYYYLLPNDVVYVPAMRARSGRLNLEVLAIILSTLSTAAVVFTVIQNNSK
ncbi:MAG: polysaccharide export protein [Flavobacteriales bacterium]|nr:polysaccharide export protein [Flavobacteriales bacterium]